MEDKMSHEFSSGDEPARQDIRSFSYKNAILGTYRNSF